MEHEKNNEELMYIDLFALLRKTMLFLRRFWAMVLALTVLGGGLMYIRSVRAYRPMYKSEAMFSVSVHYSGSTDITGYSYYYDKAAAKLVTETFPYLLQSESTQELIRQKLGVSYINGSISSSSVADTMEVYPQVSRQVIGETQLVITREPLLSFAPYNALSWKNSVFKGAAAGFLLGMGLLALMAMARRTVLSTGDVKKIVNLSCLARIPEVKVKQRKLSTNNSLLVTRQESDSAFNESFRLLRLKLLRALSSDDQVILFTSSVPSEGKSSLAVNTALTLAKNNKKVLLVDADLRCPVQHRVFNLDNKVNGLSDILAGLCSYEDLYHRNGGIENLNIITSGKIPPNPAELLASPQMAKFIERIKEDYDVVFIDLPPICEVSDAGIISNLITGYTFVVRAGYSDRRMIEMAVEIMEGFDASFVGFILNDIDIKSGDYYKNKYYSSYSKYRFRYGKTGYYRNFKYGYYKGYYSRYQRKYSNGYNTAYASNSYTNSYQKAHLEAVDEAEKKAILEQQENELFNENLNESVLNESVETVENVEIAENETVEDESDEIITNDESQEERSSFRPE